MKPLILCIIISLGASSANAQVEWALDELFPDSIKTFVVSQRGEHLLNFTHKVSPTPQPDVIKEHKLVVSDEEDPEIFFLAIQETHENGATLDISDVIELPDSTFVIPHITGWVDDQGWISVWRYFDYFGATWDSAELFCFNSFSHDLTGPTGDAFPTGEIALLGPEAHFNFNNAHGGRISYQSCQSLWEFFFEFQVQDQTITSDGRLMYTGPTGLYTISEQGVPTAHFPQWHFNRIEPNPVLSNCGRGKCG